MTDTETHLAELEAERAWWNVVRLERLKVLHRAEQRYERASKRVASLSAEINKLRNYVKSCDVQEAGG